MPNILSSLIYRLFCRLHCIDVTRLLYREGNSGKWPAPPAGYSIHVLDDEEIAQWQGHAGTPDSLLDTSELLRCDRLCVAIRYGDQLVSYLWLGRGCIEAHNNYGHSVHLGTSVVLPNGTSFVYNAWTHPEHRGLRLIGVMLGHISEHRLLGTTTMLTTVDWTNQSSRRAFGHIGMRSVGLVWRLGWSRFQLTILPSFACITDLHLATTTPGLVIAPTGPPNFCIEFWWFGNSVG